MDILEFIEKGVSPFHVVAQAAELLEAEGFCRLEETKLWQVEPGGKYYVTRNQSSIIAFCLPKNKPVNYHIMASHSDSPTFRIKKLNQGNTDYGKAEVEGYGGMIYSSWLDRPLTIAGRLLIDREDGLESKLVYVDKDLLVIPNLAIHFNREINKGYAYNPQVDLQSIYGGPEADLEGVLREAAGLSPEDEIVDHDLVLVTRQKPVRLGTSGEFFMAPRIDDLACVATTLEGFLQSMENSCDSIRIWTVFDNEEVGSGTRQGAMSNFLPQTMERIEEGLGLTRQEGMCLRSASLLISADNAHATHPNLPAKSDSQFSVCLGGGIVVKYNASQKYTSTGLTAAALDMVCLREGLMTQAFANRADSPGGSTLGNLLSQQLSIPMVDIGIPQWAMHSAVETAACQDLKDMIVLSAGFYASDLIQVEDGKWKI
ncbi:MAG: M18 family aminopeptidase [Eubacterium sp.]|nr:M18 family aminopeptidase [Eubacterium sp.]